MYLRAKSEVITTANQSKSKYKKEPMRTQTEWLEVRGFMDKRRVDFLSHTPCVGKQVIPVTFEIPLKMCPNF